MFNRVFKSRASERDVTTDQHRQKRLLVAIELEILSCQSEKDGLGRRYKAAQDESMLLLHALESRSDAALDKRLLDQEANLMKCERRLEQLAKQAAFLQDVKSALIEGFASTETSVS